MGSMLVPNRVIAKDVKSCTYCCYFSEIREIYSMSIVNALSKNRRNSVPGLPGCAIKWLVVCNDQDLEPLDLVNGLALRINRTLGLLSYY